MLGALCRHPIVIAGLGWYDVEAFVQGETTQPLSQARQPGGVHQEIIRRRVGGLIVHVVMYLELRTMIWEGLAIENKTAPQDEQVFRSCPGMQW